MARKLPTAILLAASALLLGGCNVLDSIQETLNVLDVKFSSDDPAYSGPTISGPDVVTAAAQLALPVSLGGKTKSQILAEYSMVVTFRVVGDNSGNKGKASFGQHVQPTLNLYINTKSNAPIQATIAPFSIDSGAIGHLEFPVSIPLNQIQSVAGGAVLDSILVGSKIPYYLTGSLDFDLLQGVDIQGTGKAEVDLATGAIPTRPSGSLNLTDLLQFL